MKGGRLRKRVDWQRLTITVDSFGQSVETWTTLATMWASIRPMTGREREIAFQLRATGTHRVEMRWTGLTNGAPQFKDRLVYQGRELNIDAVIDVEEKHQTILLDCTEPD